jgi:hypothetical protein
VSIINELIENGFIEMPLTDGNDSFHNIFNLNGNRYIVSITWMKSISPESDSYTYHHSGLVNGMRDTCRVTWLREPELRIYLSRFMNALRSGS